MDLYCNHLTKHPPKEPQNITLWREKISKFEADPMYNILLGELEGKAVSTVTLIVIENLTRNLHPYAIIENVVTHTDCRGRGYAKLLMQKAIETAAAHGCYKIMLQTGSKEDETLRFYENCGFNRNDKTGFVHWLIKPQGYA